MMPTTSQPSKQTPPQLTRGGGAVAAAKSAARLEAQDGLALPHAERRLAGVRVLIVDDDRNTREMMTEALQLYGAEVRAAGSAAEALMMVQAWGPDLIVSDVGMPEEDGYQFIRKLRALPSDRGGAMPAIALTGYARPEDRSRVLDAGYQLFLPKPANLEELIDGIVGLMQTA